MAGQKGNTNALKHGIYARRYTTDEQAALRKTDPADLRHEIASMRVSLAKASAILDKVIQENKENPQSPPPIESVIAYGKLLASMAAVATSINSLVRSHALLTGPDSRLEDAILQALNNIDPYLD